MSSYYASGIYQTDGTVIAGDDIYSSAEVDALLAGVSGLAEEDIDTLAEINAILTDANLASVAYVDGLASNYATAAQGAKADTALQPDTTIEVDGLLSPNGNTVNINGSSGMTQIIASRLVFDASNASSSGILLRGPGNVASVHIKGGGGVSIGEACEMTADLDVGGAVTVVDSLAVGFGSEITTIVNNGFNVSRASANYFACTSSGGYMRFVTNGSALSSYALEIATDNTARLRGPLELASKTIATLPAAAASNKQRFLVTDSTPANQQVFSNGTNWYYEDGTAV